MIQVTLPTKGIALSLQKLVQSLLLLSLGVAALAALASLLLGRWLGRPLRALTGAAARIGRGDLDTPILVAPGGEIGTLAATLEEMRWRLLRLTADLRRKQSESQAIITGIVEGVFSVDRERRIRYVNPQAAALLGLSEQEIVGRFCGDVLNPEGPDGTRPCTEHCPIVHARFRGGAQATERLLLRDGSRRSVVITSAPFADEQQVQVLRDETEVEATRRLRDAVLANISHEFRTPLSAQLASIDLLLDQLPDLSTEQIGQLILSLQRGTLRLTQLIDNLLESARIEAGRHAIRRRPVALDEVVESALELTRPLLRQREQEVSVDLPFPLPQVIGDAPLLTQVFVNLLANANKFAPAVSTISIGGEVADAEVALWVEDQGPGLPANTGTALFGRFVRSGADEPEQSGVGLGLWIVQSIVERHGGRVEAQGTRFSVVLPLEKSVPVERLNV
jgi:PAS domain S-box-containing protein